MDSAWLWLPAADRTSSRALSANLAGTKRCLGGHHSGWTETFGTQSLRSLRKSPSTHNTQGWRLAVHSASEATLSYDHARTLPAEDIHGDFNIINMGIFARAAEIAAASLDNRIETEFAIDESYVVGRYKPVAKLHLHRGGNPGDAELLPSFLNRGTSRIPYDGRNLDERHLLDLQEWVATHGHQLSWTDDAEAVKWFIELNAETIAEDLQSPPVRRELHRWTRVTQRQAKKSGDGLWARCMNQNGVLLWYMTKFPRILRVGAFRRFFKRRYLATQEGTPAVGWIEGSLRTREQQFQAGRIVLGFWIRLTQFNIRMLPYGSLYTNQASNTQVGGRTGAPGFWLIFRMGYGPLPPESYRLPTSSLFIGDGVSRGSL